MLHSLNLLKLWKIDINMKVLLLEIRKCTNALLIHQEITQSERLIQLNQLAITQMKSLVQQKKAIHQLKM